MAQINKPSDYFNTKLYTGNATVRSITGVGFQPDWTWIQRRSGADNHYLFDAVRGVLKFLSSNGTGAEVTRASSLTSFDSDGFSLGTHGDVNSSGQTFASWSWLGGNGTASNTDGDVTSTVSANTTSGFSIVKWTAPGTSTAINVGHGLGVAPKVLITKCLGSGSSIIAWYVYHESLGNSQTIYLNNQDAAVSNSTIWDATTPTSTVFKHNSGADNLDYVSYCFAEKKGFSKFGQYAGNFSTDGPFVYCGFKPAFIMAKASSRSEDWYMFDNKRLGYNPNNEQLYANNTSTEGTVDYIDILSNGFKLKQANYGLNGPSETYIYMAFAENPLVGTNNIPATAR